MTEKMMGHGRAPNLMAIYDEADTKNKVNPIAITRARSVNPLSPFSSGIMQSPERFTTINYISVV
jgi:hypothetical protein